VFRGQKVLALVPARSGSKRLPGKNLQSVAGKPLVTWALEAGVGAVSVDRTVLSTDDDALVASAAVQGFADFLMRPAALASDDASMTSVIVHAIETLKERGDEFGYMVLLQPTSPLRTAQHIDQAFVVIEEKGALGVVSICRTEHPQEWMGKLAGDGLLDSFFRETELERQSQAFEPSYQVNGAIYIIPVEKFLTHKTLFLPYGMAAFVMERQESVDIDNEHDLQLAEWLLRGRRVAEVSQDDDE
jgi:CMP-N,N'-diacetyllegionaminic acid synthase